MSELRNSSKGHPSAHYVWEYEYYEDDEPVSFDNLTVHRYSVVIGFWVGLALFVIFMFFVLTLLTKTGPQHQENLEPYEKHCRPSSCMVDIRRPQASDGKACSHPLLDESRSLLHCFLHEEEPGGANEGHGQWAKAKPYAPRECSALDQVQAKCRPERDTRFLIQFSIPNSVNSEHSSALSSDELLLCEPPVITM